MRKVRLIASLLALVLVLSACAEGSSPDTVSDTVLGNTATTQYTPPTDWKMDIVCPLLGTPCPPVTLHEEYKIVDRELSSSYGGTVVLENTSTGERTTWTLGDTQSNRAVRNYDYVCVAYADRGFSTATGGFLYNVKMRFSQSPDMWTACQ